MIIDCFMVKCISCLIVHLINNETRKREKLEIITMPFLSPCCLHRRMLRSCLIRTTESLRYTVGMFDSSKSDCQLIVN